MPVPYQNAAQVRIIGRIHGQQTVNVLHFGTNLAVFDATSSIPQLQALAQAVLQCVRDALLVALPAEWTLEKVDAKLVHPFISDPVEITAVGTDVGTLGESDVSFASQLLQLRTNGGGRSGRGRMFMPPPPEGGIQQSRLTPGQLALLAAFAACLVSKFTTGGSQVTAWRLNVYSRKLGGTKFQNYNTGAREVTNVLATNTVAVMRRRKVGVGS